MLPMLKDFVVQNNVVSIPNDSQALVAEAPPYNSQNAAYINVPGPFDHGVASTYNIAPPDPKWSKASRPPTSRARRHCCSPPVHEVWPGHFLQFLHSNANPNKLEALWVGNAYAEGWAHYCEEMMVEMGLGKGEPESTSVSCRGAAARCAAAVRHRHAHQGHDCGAIGEDVPGAGLPGSGQCPAAGGPGHL
jgi:hypothetical protein